MNISSVVSKAFSIMFNCVLTVLGQSGSAFVTAFISQMLGDTGNFSFWKSGVPQGRVFAFAEIGFAGVAFQVSNAVVFTVFSDYA